MATKSEKIEIIKRIIPPLRKTDEELANMTVKELNAIIESNNGVTPADDTTTDLVDVPKKSEADSAVHFTMIDGKKRSFTKEIHGEDFTATADEFHTTNKSRIRSRVDE